MKRRLLAALFPMAFASILVGQGPDVIVGSISDVDSYGSQGSIAAFALGTVSCNVGTAPLSWLALPNTNHPVIAQDLYRIRDGRLEHVGMSWLKHGFAALNGTLCGSCSPTSGLTLGVGCSDPYRAGLNGSQGNLGPRSDVNASTGVFPIPNPPGFSGVIARRLQVHHQDLDPVQNPGATYLAHAHYVTRDDAMAGNAGNNASWRLATVAPSANTYAMSLAGITHREECAVEAWASLDATVQTQFLDIPGDGRVWVGYKATPDLAGTRHTLAIMNLDSHESLQAVEVAQTTATGVTGLYFRDVDYHSGEPYSGTDWISTVASNGVKWETETLAQNPNANALRWGTTYTFEFVSTEALGNVFLTTFRSGQQHVLTPFGTPPPPHFQVNQAGKAALDVNGLTNDGSQPIVANLGLNEAATLNFSGAAGATFDIGIMTPDPIAGLAVTPANQVLNIDPADPTFAFLLGGPAPTPLPVTAVAAPFTTPGTDVDVSLQLIAIDAASPDGMWLSAAVDVRAAACLPRSEYLFLGDDDFGLVAVGPNTQHGCVASIPFGSTSYADVYVNSNGSVTFGGGDTNYIPSTAAFVFGPPRLAGTWTDLDPSNGGTIEVTSTASGVLRISYAGVPQFGGGGSASFDLEFDAVAGSCAVQNYTTQFISAATLVGLNPQAGGSSVAVNFGTLAGSGPQTGAPSNAVYQFVGASPGGFSSIVFPTADGASYIVN